MFKKIEIWILYLTIIVALIFSIFFGTLVRQELVGSIKLGVFSKSALFLSEIPKNLKFIFQNTDLVLADRFPDKPGGFSGVPLDEKTFLLLTRWDGDLNESIVELVDLTNFNTVHSWNPDITYINSLVDKNDPQFKNLVRDTNETRYEIVHPLLNEDGSLVFQSSSPLVKVDFCSNLIWQNSKHEFHHGNELDSDGNIWTSINMYPFEAPERYVGSDIDGYEDNGIAQVSQNGEIVFERNLTNLFIANGLKHKIFASSESFQRSPFSINEVQPVLEDGPYWKAGDVFISLRHMSMSFLYRPSTDKIIWKDDGKTYLQHDINVLNDSQISIFNNNALMTHSDYLIDTNSEVLIYDFSSQEYTKYLNDALIKHEVKTFGQGRSRILPNGDLFIEETNFGRILYFNSQGKLLWEYINREDNKKVNWISWARIVYLKKDISNIENIIENQSCEID